MLVKLLLSDIGWHLDGSCELEQGWIQADTRQKGVCF